MSATAAPDLSPLGRWALLYAERGVPVFPLWWARDGRCACGQADCAKAAKHPRIRAKDGGRGFLDATTDADVIAGWWRRWPQANIGAPTGSASGWWVLDVDPRHGGARVLADLESQFGDLPPTATVHTGGGGLHFYFRHPGGGVRVVNKAEAVGPGLDVRGDGGYIILPPSVHASGAAYRWARDRVSVVADAPAWLLDRVCERPAAPRRAPPSQPRDGYRYARVALERECAALASTTPGGRNDAANRAGFNVGQLVGAGALDEDEATGALVAAACAAGLPEHEARSAVASGFRAGRLKPRCIDSGRSRR